MSATSTAPKTYHHGDLPETLLVAAEVVLLRDGIRGLGLRAIAREAGVSHTAPKHHFGDITGLLSALAAVGYARLREALLAGLASAPSDPGNAVGRAYVRFATANPELFSLMFRNELVDMNRASLGPAVWSAMGVMAAAIGEAEAPGTATERAPLSSQAVMRVTAAWSYVHGLASLSIDNRLRGLVRAAPGFESPKALVDAVLEQVRMRIEFAAPVGALRADR